MLRKLDLPIEWHDPEKTITSPVSMAFEINVTNKCNMTCSFCNLKRDDSSHLNIEDTLSFIEKFIKSEGAIDRCWNNYRISLWGGEPTTEPEILEKVAGFISQYGFKLHIYTNGLDISHVISKLTYIKEHVALTLSFDGSIPKGGHQFPDKVKANIIELDKLGFKFKCKPTLGWNDIEYMSNAYFEFKELNKIISRPLSYVVSLDYKSNPNSKDIPLIMENFKKQLQLILEDQAADMVSGIEPFKMKLTEHFKKKDKPKCSAGANMIMIDIDGKIYPCHAALSADMQEDHYLGSINDSPDSIINSMTKYINILGNDYNNHCQNICTSACFNRCPIYRYADSKKESYEHRWTDYQSNHFLCGIFKYISKCIDDYENNKLDL